MSMSVWAMAALLSTGVGDAPPARPLVGAIRWDCWYGEGGPVAQVERSLGQRKYHFRLPYFAKVLGDDLVRINGDSQDIIDQEITYAAEAGLDYWAFVDYGDDGDLTIARRRYQAAANKRGIRYCFVEEGGRLDGRGTAFWPRMVEHFKNADYVRVCGGRPLLFVFGKPPRLKREAFEQLAALTVAAGLGRPYVAFMGWSPAKDQPTISELGFDAFSAYAAGAGYAGEMMTYAALTEHVRTCYWAECQRLKLPMVTFATAGWDTRPRQERPPTWIRNVKAKPDPTPPAEQQPLIDAVTAKPEQLATHVQAAVQWTREHPEVCPAQAVILYAWNENDEGGWLIPTLGEGDARIKALAGVLRR